MNCDCDGTSTFKVGPKHSAISPNLLKTPALHRIIPLPICRKNLLNSQKLRKRFKVDGHKYFAKLSAAGPGTCKILQDIRRSHCFKSAQKFEFDPYLCDYSYISDLKRICHKIQGTKHLNLVIRRVTSSYELQTLSPFIARFSRIRSFRVEFPSTQNVNEDSLIQLYKGIYQCSFLKSMEWKDVSMPERSLRFHQTAIVGLSKLKWLENYKSCSYFKKGAIKNEHRPQETWKRIKEIRFKSLDMRLSVSGEWANMGMKGDVNMKSLRDLFTRHTQLEKLKLMSMRTFTNYQDTLDLLTAISVIKTLRHFEFEFLNRQIGDLEVAAIAHGLVKIAQLKYFSLKIIQNPNVSEECIEKFTTVISKLDNLLKFDLYFRRLTFHPQAILDLGKRLGRLSNIKCSCAKESIHIFRN